ncbi:MAG: DNA-directed RNA polymerase subunit beta' [Dehalococcoidia bacterium]|nr:DNA-directed RNA polymerase subunit beta' [Dehalococcoidia bacterium]
MPLLEVNDFNAVRISLASPEQVRSWSYGEVTKPETINYRTLKPEKDGLFCEKIFGPQKDFECYCGKYKRVRYKGIICDKCGVEVARSKVRRERMGHIELASPVAHIWFVKGTPSRIGLLLDVSPRNLERVLYFAQYIVTHVDEAAKKRALEHLQEEMKKESDRREKEWADMLTSVESKRDTEVEALKERREAELASLEEEGLQGADALMQAAVDMEQTLTKAVGTLERKAIEFQGEPIVPANEVVTEAHVEALKQAVQKLVVNHEEQYARRKADVELVSDAAIKEKTDTANSEAQPLRAKIEEERKAVVTQFEEDFKELDGLKDPAEMLNSQTVPSKMRLLLDSEYKKLTEKFGTVFNAAMGADALLNILNRIDLDKMRTKLQLEMQSTSGQKRKQATKRLRVVEALRKSGNRPQWMVLTALPVLPPDLRPMVQLDGGRFATSDLNDLYRRVINRNNRLKRLLELGAPEIIIRNEKRMLQEAVDSLIDNGRRGRAVSGTGNHKLKSLSDMLKGKQGRFRQNLLGKRVDYSGRSVIVVGPELKLHQCGLPKRMALELFKPFVMHALVERGLAHNIKSAKRIVERARPEVWDVLDDVIKTRPVLLNRAPTLHRLGIQAFEPVLVEGSAIQIHPLVCLAFNADFDGDQMAVHVPLSREAVAEARQIMLATKNLLSPSSGDPMVAPRLDIVLGCFYMTAIRKGAKGEFTAGVNGTPTQGVYGSFQAAIMAYDLGLVELQALVRVRDRRTGNQLIETTVGRIFFNEALSEEIPFVNETLDSKALKAVVQECYKTLGMDRTSEIVDQIKNIGFHYATKSGVTISVSEIKVPEEKAGILVAAEQEVAAINDQYQMGLITEQERYDATVNVWNTATESVTAVIQKRLPEYGSVFLMATSGAKGNIAQIRQMAGMRGLMSDPSGRIIELPIKSNFREGLSVLEYFISTHGARKGLADTALRTADSGYLTRRLIDVAQDVITLEDDCETFAGVWLSEPQDRSVLESLRERIIGRFAASDMAHPETGEVIIERNEVITAEKADELTAAGHTKVHVRSALTCAAKRGICALCYGLSPATGELVEQRQAVGIVAAQSIGEPGTQLTMRTFHTGGVYVAGGEITTGLPRVTELFEARVPKNAAIISEIDGVVEITREGETARRVRIVSSELYSDRYDLPEGVELIVTEGQQVESGAVLARSAEATEGSDKPVTQVIARLPGRVTVDRANRISILYEEREEREYVIPATAHVRVEPGQYVHAGQQITDGPLDPQKILNVLGPEAVQLYLVEEVQKVYRNQGVNINDKHIETIVRQMMRKVIIDSPGDTAMLPGEYIDRFEYEEANANVFAEGGEPATAVPVLLGVTKASLNTSSFLAAASFQETTRVLTEAAISGKTDRLMGLKENVIIGKLIPARAEIFLPPRPVEELRAPRRLLEEGDEGYDPDDPDGLEPEDDLDLELDDDSDEDLTLDGPLASVLAEALVPEAPDSEAKAEES